MEGAVRNLRAAERDEAPAPGPEVCVFLRGSREVPVGGRLSVGFGPYRLKTHLAPVWPQEQALSVQLTQGLVASPGHGGGSGTRRETLAAHRDAYSSVRSGGFVCCGQCSGQ